MLFMPMMLAEVLAAFSASGVSCGPTSPTISLIPVGLRLASAGATKVPARCCGVSAGSVARLPRFSFWSLAYSGRRLRRASSDMAGSSEGSGMLEGGGADRGDRRMAIRSANPLPRHRRGGAGVYGGLNAPRSATQEGLVSRLPASRTKSGRLVEQGVRVQHVLALLPVAGAELVGLQGVEDAQHFLRVAADVQAVHRGPLDGAVRVDDEGRAQRHAGFLVEDAERGRELALDVGQHRDRQVADVVVVDAPVQVHELAIGGDAVDHRVTVGELARQLGEGRDLGRADEGEVLRPEEDDLPLAGIGLGGDLGEGLAGAAEALRAGLHGGELESRELVANGQHAVYPLGWAIRRILSVRRGGSAVLQRSGYGAGPLAFPM